METKGISIVVALSRKCLYAAGLCMLVVSAQAQSRPSAYPLWTIDTLRSTVLGETRTIFLAPPSDYNRAARVDERFPVLIVFDAEDDEFLAAFVSNARMLAHGQAIPPLIVVGVQTTSRFRDFAPTAMGGNADKFAQFLETELLPSLRARYRTLPFTILAGHSMSGLFVAYAYGHSPGFVNAAIAISPSLVSQNDRTIQLIADGIRGRTASGRFFVGTGTAEGEMDSAAKRLATVMRAGPAASTVFSYHALVGDSHYTSPLQGSIDGLRFIFAPIQLSDRTVGLVHRESAIVYGNGALLASSEDELAAYRSVRSSYAEGARRLGLPERLPPFFGGALGQWLASSERASAATVICQDVIDSHPDNWLGYDCLAQAQRSLSDSLGSAASYRKALELAEGAKDAAVVARLRRGLNAVVPKVPPNELLK